MICKNCGSEIPDGFSFCTECGAPVTKEQEQPDAVTPEAYQTPVQEPQYIPVEPDPRYVPVQDRPGNSGDVTPIFVLGILSIAIPAIGGLVCAIICRKKIKAYLAGGGSLTGLAKVGNILSIVGLAVSIVTCVYITVYLCIMFAVYGTAFIAVLMGILSNSTRR